MLDETAIGAEFDPQTGQVVVPLPPADDHPATSGAEAATPGSAISLSCSQLPQARTEPAEPQGAAWEVQHGLSWRASAARETRALPVGSRAVELVHWSMAQPLPDEDDLEAGGERGCSCEVACLRAVEEQAGVGQCMAGGSTVCLQGLSLGCAGGSGSQSWPCSCH